MGTGTIIASWQDTTFACISVAVVGDDPTSIVEYLARTPLTDAQGRAKSVDQLKAELQAMVCQARNRQQVSSTTPLGLSGNLSL
jgi:hypothetical protein